MTFNFFLSASTHHVFSVPLISDSEIHFHLRGKKRGILCRTGNSYAGRNSLETIKRIAPGGKLQRHLAAALAMRLGQFETPGGIAEDLPGPLAGEGELRPPHEPDHVFQGIAEEDADLVGEPLPCHPFL